MALVIHHRAAQHGGTTCRLHTAPSAGLHHTATSPAASTPAPAAVLRARVRNICTNQAPREALHSPTGWPLSPYYAECVDPYAVLGVAHDASDEAARRAYLRLARRTHPDVRGGDPNAAEQMRRINEAWALLSDTPNRSEITARPAPNHSAAAGAHSRAGQAAEVMDPETVDEPFNRWRAGDDFDGDDTPLTPARLPTWMRLGAPAGFVAGVFMLIFAVITGLAVAAAMALMTLAVSGLMFLVAPFVVLASSRRNPPMR